MSNRARGWTCTGGFGACEASGTRYLCRVRVGWIIATVIWSVSILTGFAFVIDYHSRPGQVATVTADWPTESRMKLATEGATAVMFVHAACPCSYASLKELESLLVAEDGVKSYVVLVRESDDGHPTRTSTLAHAMRNVTILSDPAGVEARLFGSHTSGDLYIFNSSGKLTFQGGITAGRGHVGENPGAQAAKQSYRGSQLRDQFPVFGCPLFDNEEQEE